MMLEPLDLQSSVDEESRALVGYHNLAGAVSSPAIPEFSGHKGFYQRNGKRFLDVLLALGMLFVVWPVIVLLACLVAMDGKSPFFAHNRVGRNCRIFRCYKIRSMVPNAEERLRHILATDPDAAAEWREQHKLTRDPRVTWIGRLLRATSLDELPQLWNVLVGDMSLVGPRPITPDELEIYGERKQFYLALRPGLSGPWQVGMRNAASFEERVLTDAAYSRGHSFIGDMLIVLKTAGVVIRRTGC